MLPWSSFFAFSEVAVCFLLEKGDIFGAPSKHLFMCEKKNVETFVVKDRRCQSFMSSQ